MAKAFCVGDQVRVLYTGMIGEIHTIYGDYAWVLRTDEYAKGIYPTTVALRDLRAHE